MMPFKPNCTVETEAGEHNHAAMVVTKNCYFDLICKSTAGKTYFAAVSIIELICRLLIKELPTWKSVLLRSGNAGTYKNNLRPVFAPFIFQKYGVELCSIIFSETQDGNSPADIYFATATKLVDKYIDTEGLEIVTPVRLVLSLNYDRSMSGSVAELFKVNEEHENYSAWKNAL